jgi:hypothetical protein
MFVRGTSSPIALHAYHFLAVTRQKQPHVIRNPFKEKHVQRAA